MIVSVAVSAAVFAIDKPYSYRVPDGMDPKPGMRVFVPFGRGNRQCEAMVLSVSQEEPDGLKAIEGVLDDAPVLSEEGLRLAAFLRERYFCTFYDAAKAMLPAGIWFQTEEAYVLTDTVSNCNELTEHSPLAASIMKELVDRGGRLEASFVAEHFPDGDAVKKAITLLKKKKYISSSLDFTRKVHDKTEKIASLHTSAEEAMAYARRKRRSAPLQYEVLKLLTAIGSGSTKEICYLTGATMATLNRLEALGYLSYSLRPVFRSSLPDTVTPAEPICLNEKQKTVYDGLAAQSALDKPGVSLLYGVTGSGKTSVYLRLIQNALDHGKTALYLVPEISLTPQLVQLLMSHFGREVAVLHSALRVSERYDTWKKIRENKAKVVIGTRSAVFAPLENLGVIVVDEEQDHSYKSENTPRYHAREVAIYRGSKAGSLVVLGSATPSLESMYLSKNGTYTLHVLSERYNGKALPQVELVDMKQELRSGNSTSISKPLQKAIRENLDAGRQSILFLNRRGAGRYMICVDCGEVPMCPRCSVSLTYHRANGRLMCHYCGHSQTVPDRCPHCGGKLKTVGTGTQKVEQELQVLFPGTEILRMDADTVTASNSHEAMLERFQKENIPILLGTQMVTKGLNFENVTLVGIVDADMSLYVDHYRGAETTFSLLTQVIGRAGRGEQTGRALIQTMTPEHTVMQLAAQQDYDRFYDLEITLRQLQNAPPHKDVFTITFVGIFESNTVSAAGMFRQMLISSLQTASYRDMAVDILGPSPCAITKVNNAYRYRLVIHCSNSRSMRLLLAHLLREFAKNKNCRGITAFADINAYE